MSSIAFQQDPKEVDIDISVLTLHQSCILEQGVFRESEMVKWRGAWVIKMVIKRQVYQHHPEKRILSAKENTLSRELRHSNILQFLGSIVHGQDMILITKYLPKVVCVILNAWNCSDTSFIELHQFTLGASEL